MFSLLFSAKLVNYIWLRNILKIFGMAKHLNCFGISEFFCKFAALKLNFEKMGKITIVSNPVKIFIS